MRLIVDVQIVDLERAVRFYTEVLGFSCRIKADEWASITIGDAEIHLYKHGGVSNGIEFYVDDLDEEAKKFAEHGVEFVSGIEKPSAVSVDKNSITEFPWGRIGYFYDSEGNELALVKDF